MSKPKTPKPQATEPLTVEPRMGEAEVANDQRGPDAEAGQEPAADAKPGTPDTRPDISDGASLPEASPAEDAGLTLEDRPAADTPPAPKEQPPKDKPADPAASGDPSGDEGTNGGAAGSTTSPPPWQRAGTVATDDTEPKTVVLQVTGSQQPLGAGPAKVQPKVQPKAEQPRPTPRATGYSSGVAARSDPGPTRYGRSVAQPLSGQSSRTQDFSQPTVRIGGHVQSGQGLSQPSASTRVRPTRVPRRASLQLRYLEPWSVLKVSLVLSVAGFFAWMMAVGVLYSVLAGMGVWDQLNGTYSDLTSVSDQGSDEDLISAGGVFGVAALIGLVNIVLITAMCTVGALIYNASADLAGGIEVTLAERD